jgi:hypothetical protein
MSMFWQQFSGLKKIIARFIFSFATAFSLLIIFNSCAEDPSDLGTDILPSTDNIVVKVDSSTVVNSYTISGKSVLTSVTTQNQQLYALGSLKDSIFGIGAASILTQFHPAILMSAGSPRTVDSLVLYLSSANFYGDSLSQMRVRVFELNQKLRNDTVYYSDINPAEYSDLSIELANTTFNVGDTLIRIKITDTEFIDKFETMNDSVFKDLNDFRDNFYGIYLSVDEVTEKGGYAYLNMRSEDTKFTLYFNGDTISDIYDMAFTNIAAKANAFSHEYNGFPISENIDKPENHDSVMYIEGLAGTSGRISFPNLDIWKDKGLITINKAELILSVDQLLYPSLSEDDYPPDLYLLSLNDTVYSNLYDDLIDQTGTYFGGTYIKTQNVYVFNIGLHLQSFISDKIDNTDLVLISRNTNSTANRVILKGANSFNSPVKLKVIYTELF